MNFLDEYRSIDFLWGSEQNKNKTRQGNNLEENLREVDSSLDGNSPDQGSADWQTCPRVSRPTGWRK